MSLEKSLTVLAGTRPPKLTQQGTSIAEMNSKIFHLESQLGMSHRPPIFTFPRAAMQIVHLENLLAQRNPAAPVIAAPVVADVAAADILKTTAAGFLKLEASARAHFCEQGGAMAAAEFEQLAPKFKMSFIMAGGNIMDESAPPRRASVIKDPPPVSWPQAHFAGNGSTKTEAEFEALSAEEKMSFMRNHGRVSED